MTCKVGLKAGVGAAAHDPWAGEPTLEALKRHDIWQLRRQFLERLWPAVQGWRVLEVGSGPAHDSLTFAERGADVTGLDCSATGLAMGEKFYREQGLSLRTMRADASQMPFASGQFDLAFNAGVLEHFEDAPLRAVLSEMKRVVRPGGHVLAFCPNRYNVFYQHHLRKVEGHAYEFERAFTASEMRAFFRQVGLTDVRLSGVHVHPAPNYFLPRRTPGRHRIEPFCRACFGWLERMNGLHRIKSLVGQDFVVWGRVREAAE